MSRTDLIKVQRRSFDWLKGAGLSSLFGDLFPAEDWTGNFEVRYIEHRIGRPHLSIRKAKEYGQHYDAALFMTMLIMNRSASCCMEQPVWLCDVPLMTGKGSFVYSGMETIVASQLVPMPGIYFSSETDEDGDVATCSVQIIPARGAWLEIDIDEWDTVGVRFDRGRRLPVETLLRTIGCNQRELASLLQGTPFSELTLAADHFDVGEEFHFDVLRRVRSGNLIADPDKSCFEDLFCDKRRYDLSLLGRLRLNRRLRLTTVSDKTTLSKEDVLRCIDYLVCLNSNLPGYEADHELEQMKNYRVLAAGEVILERLRVGLWHMQQQLLARLGEVEWLSTTPQSLINTSPLEMAIRDLFEFGSVIDEVSGLEVFADRSDEFPRCTIPLSTCKDGSGLCVHHICAPLEVNCN